MLDGDSAVLYIATHIKDCQKKVSNTVWSVNADSAPTGAECPRQMLERAKRPVKSAKMCPSNMCVCSMISPADRLRRGERVQKLADVMARRSSRRSTRRCCSIWVASFFALSVT